MEVWITRQGVINSQQPRHQGLTEQEMAEDKRKCRSH